VTGTGPSTWHADDGLVDGYLAGHLDLGLSASLEAHLLSCELCRSLLATRLPAASRARVDRTWASVRERVDVPVLPLPVRLLRRLGTSEATAVVLAAARSMSTAWTLATVAVLLFAALAVLTETDAGRAVYLVIAPLIPVAGVVGAFGSTADPVAELTRTTAYPPARLVLVRAAGVVVTSVPLAMAVGLVLPGSHWLAFAWLAPGLAFILVVLAASTWIDPVPAGGVVALTWAAVVAESTRSGDPFLAVDAAMQVGSLALAAAAALTLALRFRLLSYPGGT